MTHIEKMKMWLDALEYIDDGANNQGAHTGISWRCVSNKAQPAIASLRQAIAQAEKEKALQSLHAENERLGLYKDAYGKPVIDKSAAIRIATALGWEPKREWVGLTDEDWVEIFGNSRTIGAAVRNTEAKLKEQNT